jgi:hypothetical protein
MKNNLNLKWNYFSSNLVCFSFLMSMRPTVNLRVLAILAVEAQVNNNISFIR